MDYREILSDCFRRRCKANPRYSLRAFARDLSLSPSRLSEVIAGKGELSRDKGEIIVAKMKFTGDTRANFLDAIDAVSAPLKSQRMAALSRLNKRIATSRSRELDEKSFEVISDPKYVLVWSFMMLPIYDGDPEVLVKHLGLNILEVFEILRRLARLHFIKKENQKWLAIPGSFTVGDGTPSEVIRSYHRQMAALGRKSIDSQPVASRHLDSLVIPFDSRRFPEIQQRIVEFSRSLMADFSWDGDCVYGLSLQFFRMSEPLAVKS